MHACSACSSAPPTLLAILRHFNSRLQVRGVTFKRRVKPDADDAAKTKQKKRSACQLSRLSEKQRDANACVSDRAERAKKASAAARQVETREAIRSARKDEAMRTIDQEKENTDDATRHDITLSFLYFH